VWKRQVFQGTEKWLDSFQYFINGYYEHIVRYEGNTTCNIWQLIVRGNFFCMRFEDLMQEYVKIKTLWHVMPWKSSRYRSTNWRNILPLSTNLKADKTFFLTLCSVYTRLHSVISQRTVTLWVYLKVTSPWNNDLAFYSHHHRLHFLLLVPIKMAKTFLN